MDSTRELTSPLALRYLWNGMTLHRILEIRQLSRVAPIEGDLVEIGEGVVHGPDWIHLPKRNLRSRLTIDLSLSREPSVVANAETLPFCAGFADTILMLNVLEHTQNPLRVLEEARLCLRPQGRLLLSVPFVYRIHDAVDYFRYTDECLEMLLERAGFSSVSVLPYGRGTVFAAFSIGDTLFKPTFFRRILRMIMYFVYLAAQKFASEGRTMLPMGYIAEAVNQG